MKRLAASAFLAILACSCTVHRGFVPKTPGRVRFALCQTPSGAFDGGRRVDETLDWARRGLHGDEDAIVFPELAFASFSELGTAWKEAPQVWEKAAAFARERGAWVFVNHPFRPDGSPRPFNETRVFAPDGTVAAVYRKRVLARMDAAAGFEAGPPAVPADLPFGRIGLLVCKDAFMPSQGSKGYADADALLVQFAHPGVDDRYVPEAANFPSSAESRNDLRDSIYGWLAPGRPYLAVNKTGPDGVYTLCGGTFAASGTGTVGPGADTDATIVFADLPLGPDGRIEP